MSRENEKPPADFEGQIATARALLNIMEAIACIATGVKNILETNVNYLRGKK